MATELNRRQQELFHLLERKDREIQDYKDQGSVVSRSLFKALFYFYFIQAGFMKYIYHKICIAFLCSMFPQ